MRCLGTWARGCWGALFPGNPQDAVALLQGKDSTSDSPRPCSCPPVSRPSARRAPTVSLMPAYSPPTPSELRLAVVLTNGSGDPHCTVEKAGSESPNR